MNLKQARPLALEWLSGDVAKRTSIAQSLKGAHAQQVFLQCLAESVPAVKGAEQAADQEKRIATAASAA